MKKMLTKLEKRDIIDKHSNERAQKQRVLEKAWNRLNSEKEGSRGYGDGPKNRKEETAEARWPIGKKFKTLKKEI